MSQVYDVFLSYTHDDHEWVEQFAHALSEKGLRVWYDEDEIKPGDTWGDQLQEGLRHSTYVVFVTPEKASTRSAADLGAILALRKPVIPIVAEDTPPENIPGPIKLRKQLLKGDPTAVANEIVKAIAPEQRTSGTLAASELQEMQP
jgi:hypothetical protein